MHTSHNSIADIYNHIPADEASKVDVNHLFSLTYQELRRRASRHKSNWRNVTTLTATAIVHETYEKVANASDCEMHNPSHFMAITNCAMRQVLLDHLKRRRALKRGGGRSSVTFVEGIAVEPEGDLDLLREVSEAIDRLHQFNPESARIVECRFFGGLSIFETAQALDVSEATIKRRWRIARAWLKNELADYNCEGSDRRHLN
ncbi:sigma-70 family RNA polymerase sigma factor [soil metagenome]